MYWTLEEQAEHRAEWIEALESGLYPQARYALHMRAGYCCLGVACDLFGGDAKLKVDGDAEGTHWYNGQFEVLPMEMVRYLGLVTNNAFMSAGNCLASLNDKGSSFAAIAGLLRGGDVDFFLGDEVYLERYRALRALMMEGEFPLDRERAMNSIAETQDGTKALAYFAAHYYRPRLSDSIDWVDGITTELEGLCSVKS